MHPIDITPTIIETKSPARQTAPKKQITLNAEL